MDRPNGPGQTLYDFRRTRQDDLATHSTVKPTQLFADLMFDCSRRGDIVLDPFCGSGTTLLAAARTGRMARCIELDPKYIDVAIQRWQTATGGRAIHVQSGQTAILDRRGAKSERADIDAAQSLPRGGRATLRRGAQR